jgi:hypothetical protein
MFSIGQRAERIEHRKFSNIYWSEMKFSLRSPNHQSLAFGSALPLSWDASFDMAKKIFVAMCVLEIRYSALSVIYCMHQCQCIARGE